MPKQPPKPDGPSALRAVTAVSRVLAAFRWLFMPLGLFALVAVGVHAGADLIDDACLRFLDWADGRVDEAVAWLLGVLCSALRLGPERADAWSVSWAELVDLSERALAAKVLALVAEVFADVYLALPALGYREHAEATVKLRTLQPRLVRRFSTLIAATVNDPTVLKVAAPLATLGVALAGACTVAREVQGGTFALLHGASTDVASMAGRVLAVVALLATLIALGGRAVARSIEHAHAKAEEDRLGTRTVRRRLRGILAAAVFIPIGLAALWYGAPLTSFFR